ncbi:MAG: aminotransferase class III-fold pyridoxal phosphate-dependent enzyme, partial [Sedimenticolaceae bacterium]
MTHSLMSPYRRLPVTFARGEGARLWDTDGKEYLDALSGIAVCNLG